MILALIVAPMLDGKLFNLEGWRSIFLITGFLGIIMAVVIFLFVKDMPRGQAEPEFDGMENFGQFKFSMKEAKLIFKKKTMWFIFLQGFAGVYPWIVITYFFVGYLLTERGYDNNSVLFVMGPVILILSLGYFVGGSLGDWLFKKTRKGRIIISSLGVILGAFFLLLALLTPVDQKSTFFIWMSLTALFMPFSSPNVLSTIFDITPPEVRSTAQAVEYFIENSGAALAPIIAGSIALATTKQNAILTICISTWVLCFFLYLGALFFIDDDIKALRSQMAERASLQKNNPEIMHQ
jgi:MFS family permease